MSQSDRSKGKILFLHLYNRLLAILISDNHILAMEAYESPEREIGNIYIGKVENIASNIQAAFVRISPDELIFLPLQEAPYAYLTNRKSNGTIKAGDELLIQYAKEPVKTKLAGGSATLSLTGTYVILSQKKKIPVTLQSAAQSDYESSARQPSMLFSRKLSEKDKQRFKDSEILQEIIHHYDVIIRTNAGALDDISRVITEAKVLADKLREIERSADSRICYSCLYKNGPVYLSFLQNCYQSDYNEIVTDNKALYEELAMQASILHLTAPVRLYQDTMLPLHKLYSIETRIGELLQKKVWLKSGAYIVIEQTEALVSIDVNSGKCEHGKKKEETFLKLNLEAAAAIARELRARNLAGIILVDFINLQKKEHKNQLIEEMKRLLLLDSVPARVVDMTGLGLMEITRKRINPPVAEQLKGSDPAVQFY